MEGERIDGSSYLPIARAIVARLAAIPAATDDVGLAIRHLRHAAETAVARPFFARPAASHAALLASALATSTDPIGAALAAIPDGLAWHYHYAPRADEDDLGDRIAFAEMIGPNGPLDAADCRIGFTLMAPQTLYPLHAHPAIELYLVLSGAAQWMTDTADRIVPPGEFVLHRSNEPHAMQSFAAPLLALYAWRGAIDVPAFYV
jgi:mannose-6-phosphate isomerase-like protein (cupin superfamily)